MNHIPHEIARIRQDDLICEAAKRPSAPTARQGTTTAHARSLLRLRRIVLSRAR